MGIPVVRQGFCGCTLKSSSQFIGWFSLFITVISLLTTALLGSLAANEFSKQSEGTAVTAKEFTELIMYVMLLMFTVLIIFNTMMLVGIYKERHCLIFPYICVKATILLLGLLGLLQRLLKGHFTEHNVITIIYGVLEGYFVFILFCYYKELKDKPINLIYNQHTTPDEGFRKGGFA